MISMTSQRKEFNIVISDITKCHYDLSDFYSWLDNSGFRYYLILHDKDYDSNGDLIRPHLHLVLSGIKRWRVKQLLNVLSDVLICRLENIQISEVQNLTASIQYLIHKNDSDKFQYSYESIKTNDNDNLVPILNETIKSCTITTQRLMDMILKEGINRLELINTLGIGTYQHYRPLINELYEIKNGRLNIN